MAPWRGWTSAAAAATSLPPPHWLTSDPLDTASWIKVSGSGGFKVSGLGGFKVSGLGRFKVSGSGFGKV